MKILLVLLLSVLCLAWAVNNPAHADTWVLQSAVNSDVPPPEQPYVWDIHFAFDGDVLALNRSFIATGHGSAAEDWQLNLSGTWAATGTVSASNDLIRDPYASFIVDGLGNGHIEWAADTPTGYTAPLMLGKSFNGDGAATYVDYVSERPFETTTGTLVLLSYLPLRPLEMRFYDTQSHIFYATYNSPVPEPSSQAVLAVAFAGLVGVVGRRRSSVK